MQYEDTVLFEDPAAQKVAQHVWTGWRVGGFRRHKTR